MWTRARYRPSLLCSVEMRRDYLFLFVVLSALQLISAGDYTAVHRLHGFSGGSVHMRCELEPPNNVNRLYFQKKASDGTEIFINGFASKALPENPEYQNRTTVYRSELSMEMRDLSPADEGEYTCIPFYNGVKLNQTKFHLTVTANYSLPVITVQGCGSGPAAYNCVIGCFSSGGFPPSNVTWGVVGEEKRSLLRDEGDPVLIQDAHSHLWNVSHVVTLNCSRQLNITCSVGGVVSHAVSVCLPPETTDIIMPIACAVLVLVFIAAILIIVMKCRRTPSIERSMDAELVNLK